MKLKKFAAMAVGAACLTVCAGMSMSASAAGASVSLPKNLSGIGALKTAEEAAVSASIAEAYKNTVLNYADTHSCSFSFTTVDVNISDHIDELIIWPTEASEGRVAEVYSYIDGAAVKVGEIPVGNGTLFLDMSYDSCNPIAVMDESTNTVVWYNVDGESSFEIDRIEGYDGGLDRFEELLGLIATYNEDGTWSSANKDGETVEGIDLWYFDYYYGEGGDDSFEFPEIPADATPAEEAIIVYRAFMNYAAKEFISEDVYDVEMSVFDMNKDGIPELILKDGTSEADYAYEFLTYDAETDMITYLASDIGGHSALFMDSATGQLCSHYGQMGVGSITWYDFADGEIVAQETAETFEYTEEDPYSAYAQYGDFVKVDLSANHYDSASNSWYHFVGEDQFDGFDTSVLDRYLENYNADPAPEETTAPETTTKTNSTTTSTTAGKTDSPKTGDNALPMLGAVITIAGLTAFTLRKKND